MAFDSPPGTPPRTPANQIPVPTVEELSRKLQEKRKEEKMSNRAVTEPSRKIYVLTSPHCGHCNRLKNNVLNGIHLDMVLDPQLRKVIKMRDARVPDEILKRRHMQQVKEEFNKLVEKVFSSARLQTVHSFYQDLTTLSSINLFPRTSASKPTERLII